MAEVVIGNQFTGLDVGSGTVTEIIAPSLNVAGLMIRTMSASDSGNGFCTFIYATDTAPSTPRDYSKRIVWQIGHVSSDGFHTFPYPLYVPKGLGIWLGAEQAASLSMTYDLLS